MSTQKMIQTEQDDDNKLVSAQDLNSDTEEEKVAPTLWSDSERLKKLSIEMEALSKLRVVKERYPETVLLKAMAEVLTSVGWYSYEQFAKTVNTILSGNQRSVPFSMRTKDKITKVQDFWLVRAFINISTKDNRVYEIDGVNYNKKDVLMSKEFSKYLNQYCLEQFKGEVQFWTFTGSYTGKQHLDMGKLTRSDIRALESIGETNADNLVMFQFKKRTTEVMVGKIDKKDVDADAETDVKDTNSEE